MSLRGSLIKELAEGPKTIKQLRGAVNANGKKLAKALQPMVDSGEVTLRKGVYSLALEDLIEGKLVKLGRGFGFVASANASEDIFVPGSALLGALPGDVVQVALFARPHRPGSREGEVVAITAPCDDVTGVVQEEGGRLYLLPDNAPQTPLPIRSSAAGGAKPGEKVAARVLFRGASHEEMRVGIVRRFGPADSARQCAKAILYAAGIVKAFPEKAKAQAKQVALAKPSSEELAARTDLREQSIFTIDSDATKDIDDAISAYKTENGYQLCVHIADVSHYVRAKTDLDEEALARGTSVYYADSVVPMLPRSLSNGACSLNPGEDRLAFSCLMELDEAGVLVDYRFVKSIIRSRVKGVYSEINALFAGTAAPRLKKKYTEVEEQLVVMREIYQKLAVLRERRGSMEIESDEAKLTVDEDGRCVAVEKRTRGEAERLIEEFMILANTAAAHMARSRKMPFVYRVHESPSPDKAAHLAEMLTALGVPTVFEKGVPTQQELATLLDKTRDTPLQVPVHTAVLRSMQKALYADDPKGHYGLALQDYTHFTSPIRRYPDLVVHRILSDAVAGIPGAELEKKYRRFVQSAAQISSEREQIAAQVERDCDDCYKAEYMKQFVGESFDGTIVSVAPHGAYVALPNTVEGLVHNTALSTHRLQLVAGVALQDEASGQSFKVGQPMRVTLAGVDVSLGTIDFVPAPG